MRNIIQYPIEHTDLLGAIKYAQHLATLQQAIGSVHGLSLHMLEHLLLENVEHTKQFCNEYRKRQHDH